MHSFFLRLLAAIIMLISLFFGIFLSQSGFQHIQEFKQLERIVPSSISGVLEGETQLRALAYPLSDNGIVVSPKAGVKSLYFRYLKEREERDSDGDTRWVTVEDYSRAVDFSIADHSASATVFASQSVTKIDWDLPKSFSRTEGDFRYSEWRIEPEDSLLIYGWVQIKNKEDSSHLTTQPEVSISFETQGAYLPIISTYSAGQVRESLGTSAIIKIWGGVSLLALSLFAFIYAAQIHRILVYLTLLTIITTGSLSYYGIASLVADVRGGADFLSAQQSKMALALPKAFEKKQLVPWQQERISEIRMNHYFLQQTYQQQISNFPENLFAWAAKIDPSQNLLQLRPDESETVHTRLARFEQTKVNNGWAYWWVLAGVVLFATLTWFGFRFAKIKRMIENIETTPSLGVSFGIAEVKGKVVLLEDESLSGPVSHLPCSWYRYLVEEQRGSGKDSKWVTISDDKKGLVFLCQDREGSLAIEPKDAEIITRHKKSNRSGSMRYTEWALRPNDKLYAIGQAVINPQQADQLILAKGEKEALFILSNYPERDIMIKKASSSMLTLVFAFSAMFFAAVFLRGMSGQFSAIDYLLSGLVAPVFLSVFMLVLHYNDLVFLKKRAQRNWANIQVSLKKRSTLLKQIQNVVSQYQQFEKSLLLQITQHRKKLKQDIQSVSNAGAFLHEEHQLIQCLRLTIEDHPELQADKLMHNFTDKLIKLENEVSLMRAGYNDAVNQYNTRVQSFPDLVLARSFGFKTLMRLSF